MDYYVALIHKENGSDFGVMFPDFPGCVTAGKSHEEAIQLASNALAFHVAGMREDGEKVRAPRSLKEIKAAKEDWVDFNNAVVAMVPLLPTPEGKMQPTNLSLDVGLVQAIDRYAQKMKITRSAAFAEGAKLLMQVRPAVVQVKLAKKTNHKKAEIDKNRQRRSTSSAKVKPAGVKRTHSTRAHS